MSIHDQSEVEKRLLAIFSHHLHTEIHAIESDLLESGVLDSLKFVELLLAIEMELDIKLSIQELELENFRSIQTISRFLMGRVKGNYAVAS